MCPEWRWLRLRLDGDRSLKIDWPRRRPAPGETSEPATMVVRVDEHGRVITDGPQVEIGGNDRYVSVSRAEFKKIVAGEGRIELQQSVLPL